MKYLILIYRNPKSREIWENMSPAEQAAGYGAYAALTEELMAAGELIVTEALADPSLSKRVTRSEGRTVTTDGPFAEAKEQLAGYYIVDVENVERATEIALRDPASRLWTIEVRPVMDEAGLEM